MWLRMARDGAGGDPFFLLGDGAPFGRGGLPLGVGGFPLGALGGLPGGSAGFFFPLGGDGSFFETFFGGGPLGGGVPFFMVTFLGGGPLGGGGGI